MADDRNEYLGTAYGKPDMGTAGGSGPEVGMLPPLDIAVDTPDFRYAKLSRIVAQHIVPRLLVLHGQTRESVEIPLPRTAEVAELASLVIGPDHDEAANFVLSLRDGGISLDDLHAELLEPAAQHLGDLWSEDKIDFVDVTLGVGRLQRLVHAFERLDEVPDFLEKRKVLLACAPGDQHSMGSTIVQKFLRAAGWHVWTCASERMEEAADIAAREWFGVIGFSLSSDVNMEALAATVARVREFSLNPKVGIMVGGPAIQRHPEWVAKVGADGTAANGPAAVILAKKLLAESLA